MPALSFFWIIPGAAFCLQCTRTWWVQAQPVWGSSFGRVWMLSGRQCEAPWAQHRCSSREQTQHRLLGSCSQTVSCRVSQQARGQTSLKTRPHLIIVTSNCCHVCDFLLYWLTITIACLWLFPKIQGLTDIIFKICFPLNTQRRCRTIPSSLIIPLWFHLARFLVCSSSYIKVHKSICI